MIDRRSSQGIKPEPPKYWSALEEKQDEERATNAELLYTIMLIPLMLLAAFEFARSLGWWQ